MSETQTDEFQTCEPQTSDFARALNSVMDNIENVVVNFQKTLLIILEKIEKLESSEKMPLQQRSVTHNKTGISINKGANLQQLKDEIPELVSAKNATDVEESSISKRSTFSGILSKTFKKLSSKSNYLILAIALAVLGIALVEIYFTLFP